MSTVRLSTRMLPHGTKSCVVIGGGVAGASISRVLAERGVEVTLLEKSQQLTSGATWHAAGLVTRFAGSPKLKKLHVRSLELLTALHEEHDIGLHLSGSIRLVETGSRDRKLEALHHLELARLYDTAEYPTSLIGPEEVKALHPLIDTSNIELGLYTPHDGDVDPTSLTNCVARLAKQAGANVRLNTSASGLTAPTGSEGQWAVTLEGGETLYADMVVNAAGLWAREVARMAGLKHPAFVIEHQYVITEPLPYIQGLPRGERLPVLRDLAGSSYIRQEGQGLLIGPYEEECVVRSTSEFTGNRETWGDGPPADWGMELFPPALERIEDNLAHGMELVPAMGEAGIKAVVNGPTIWAADGAGCIGPSHLPGYYDFNTQSYGIAQSLPLAEYLGAYMLEGAQPFDLSGDFDPNRIGAWANDDYLKAKIAETYSHNNHVAYGALENRPAGREFLRKHFLYDDLKAAGAVFGCGNGGVEVPLVYTDVPINTKRFHDYDWAEPAEAEAAAVLKGVGLSYAAFSKFVVSGSSAESFLSHLTTNILPKKQGQCRLTYALAPTGHVQTEFTICKTGAEEYYVVGGRDYAEQDFKWLKHHAPAEGVQIKNVSDDYEILHIAGPDAPQLLQELNSEAEQIPFLRMAPLTIGGVDLRCFRVSFTGCPGYELHYPSVAGPQLYDYITSHPTSSQLNLRPFGSFALNSMRVEKGFVLRGDLDYVHYKEANIMPFVKEGKKGGFLGLDESNSIAATKSRVMFELAAPSSFRWSVPSDCPIVNKDNQVVGYTTSGAYGVETGCTIGLGYLFEPFTSEGELYAQCYGQMWAAKVMAEPPVKVTTGPKPSVGMKISIQSGNCTQVSL